MQIVYVIISLVVLVCLYLVINHFQKKLDANSKLGELMSTKMIKENGKLKTQKQQFYDAICEKFSEEFEIKCDIGAETFNVADFKEEVEESVDDVTEFFSEKEEKVVFTLDFVFYKEEKPVFILLLNKPRGFVENVRNVFPQTLSLDKATICDDIVLSLIENKIKNQEEVSQ